MAGEEEKTMAINNTKGTENSPLSIAPVGIDLKEGNETITTDW